VLRDLLPPEKVQTLVAISSGKAETPGHRERLGFLALLRRAGVPLALFGRGLPLELGALGELRSKSTALLPAMFTLAIENHSEGELYVSEKAWDPLLCWSLPLYHGPRAIDAMVPPGSFIRLPDLQDAGVDAVRAALAGGAELWRSRLDAIAEARRRVLGDLRMVEWVRRTLVPERRA
jgi:hypothetical protein